MATTASTAPSLVQRLADLLVAKASPDDLRGLLADAEIGKALTSGEVFDIETKKDYWSEPFNSTPSTGAEGVGPIGPSQGASGGNAARMVGQYSQVVAQPNGPQRAAESIGMELARLDTMVKAQAGEIALLKSTALKMLENHTAVAKAIEALTVKPESAVAKAGEDKEAKEAKEMSGKDEEDEEKAASQMTDMAEAVFKSAIENTDRAALATGVFRALRMAKAVTEEFKGAKRASWLAKSIGVFAKAEQLTEDAVAAKAEASAAVVPPGASMDDLRMMVQKAVDGTAALKMNMSQFMDTVQRGAVASGPAAIPELFKAQGTNVIALKAGQISDKLMNNELSYDDASQARELLGMVGAVAAGRIDAGEVTRRIQLAPPSVREFFPEVLAA